jgi:hypothetical protein
MTSTHTFDLQTVLCWPFSVLILVLSRKECHEAKKRLLGGGSGTFPKISKKICEIRPMLYIYPETTVSNTRFVLKELSGQILCKEFLKEIKK